MMTDELRDALNHALCDELDAALGRVSHCLTQLTDEQMWWRPKPEMNSIGNLILHLAGNLDQMIASAVGRYPDNRDRQSEFDARESASSEALIGKLSVAVRRARDALLRATDAELSGKSKVTRFDWTGIQAVIRSVSHFRGHTQEIIHMTRTILGDKYQFAGQR
jgi:hypothetical protein